MKKSTLTSIGVTAALVASVFVSSFATADSSRPNFIFILTDDQGWTNSSVQMDPNVPESKSDFYETPNLERLAAQGMRFSNAYASAPLCGASRQAIFTGRSTAQMHYTELPSSFDPTGGQYQTYYLNKPATPPIPIPMLNEYVTLPEWIKEHAPEYQTALLGKDHVGSRPERYGFDVYDFHMFGYEPEGQDPKKVFSTANHANAFMEQNVTNGTPFFMEIATLAPHVPFEYRDETIAYFNAKPKGTRHRTAEFAASLYDFDAALGQVLDKVDQLGIADNTYIILTSDNGATGGTGYNTPLTGAKGSLWEGGIRVPMIVRGPGIAADSVSSVPVVGADIFATVSDLAGIAAPFDDLLESASLKPVLQNNGQLPEGQSLSRAFGPNGELFFHFPHYTGITTPVSAVRDGDFKLMKFYGYGGQPDQYALFNLANSITESTNLSSPFNLATQMPEKVSELRSKLETWLTGVDASYARRPEDNIELLWQASDPGEYPSLWRSTTQVDDLRRESWDVVPNWTLVTEYPPDRIAQRGSSQAYQPGLANKSFAFDGNDTMRRPYIQVSDPSRAEVDGKGHSATFEFWVRLEDLSSNQIVFESGNGQKGVSLTLGDANGDGVFNDARFRVLGANGQSVTATTSIDKFADPTQDFVQITALISDKDDDRFVSLFVNGAFFAHAQGVNGPAGRLDWDGLDDAALGGIGGSGLGANGGSGPLPFIGNLKGEIARMRFNNYSLSSTEVFQNYAQTLDPVSQGIVSVAGSANVPAGRFRTVAAGVAESSLVRVMQERTDVLAAPLAVDAIITGGEVISSNSAATPGILASGTRIMSYLLHFDPVGSNESQQAFANGSIGFENDILGVIIGDASIALTDSILGSIGNYGTSPGRGVELLGADFIAVSEDRHTLSFDWAIMGNELSQIRVVTAAPVSIDPDDMAVGDFNGDGLTDGQDLEIWNSAYGVSQYADANSDGVTDGSDFLVWQRHASAGVALQSAVTTQAAVPEPSGVMLVLTGIGCGLLILQKSFGQGFAGQ